MTAVKWVKCGNEWRGQLGQDIGVIYFGGEVFERWRLKLNGSNIASGPTRQGMMRAFEETHATRVRNGAAV